MKSHFWAMGLAAITFFEWSVQGLAQEGNHASSGALQRDISVANRHEGYYHSEYEYLEYAGNGYNPRDSDKYFTRYPDKYVPTPKQRETALQRITAFFTAIVHHRRPASKHRYIAIETLRPTSRQLALYKVRRAAAIGEARAKKTNLAAHWVAPEQLHCLMVFDTKSLQFVGNNCYFIPNIPPDGRMLRFDTVSAEFIGSRK
jgi:hypothetical protein